MMFEWFKKPTLPRPLCMPLERRHPTRKILRESKRQK